VYLIGAIALGAGFIIGAALLIGHTGRALSLFRYSNVYLALLFGAVALDVLLESA